MEGKGLIVRCWIFLFFKVKTDNPSPTPIPLLLPPQKKNLKKICQPQWYFGLFFFSKTVIHSFYRKQKLIQKFWLATSFPLRKKNEISCIDCISWKPFLLSNFQQEGSQNADGIWGQIKNSLVVRAFMNDVGDPCTEKLG